MNESILVYEDSGSDLILSSSVARTSVIYTSSPRPRDTNSVDTVHAHGKRKKDSKHTFQNKTTAKSEREREREGEKGREKGGREWETIETYHRGLPKLRVWHY